MQPLFLNDTHITEYLTPAEAVSVMEQVFLARAKGNTSGMPRWKVPFAGGDTIFTVGGVENTVGFRAYLRGKLAHDDQLNAVWEQSTGRLKGVVVGAALGVMRTGAIGGVAVKYLAPPGAETLALIGTGRQAMSQLQAVASVVSLKEVRIYSRTPAHREKFCIETSRLLPDLKIYAAENAESAVRNADIIIGATTSREPVIKGEWIKPGAHLTTIGSKSATSREIDEEAVNRAGIVVTDSPEQVYAAEFASLLEGTQHTLIDLAQVVSRQIERPAGKISLFLSVGLAGTEVALTSRLMEKLK